MPNRSVAYRPRLDLAIRAGLALKPRRALRPYGMIERKRQASVTARADLNGANSASYARQIVYTNDGDKIARQSGALGGGGGGGNRPSGGGGGGWPFP